MGLLYYKYNTFDKVSVAMFLRVHHTGEIKITKKSFSSRFRVFRINNYITGAFLTINAIPLENYCKQGFIHIYPTCQFKITKEISYSPRFRVFAFSRFYVK